MTSYGDKLLNGDYKYNPRNSEQRETSIQKESKCE